MAYWLMKTEPSVFSLEDLAQRSREPWDGIRNYQARNFLRSMQVGDDVLFYHSRCPIPGVVGLARICTTARPDPTQFDPTSHYFDPASSPQKPRWDLVDVAYVRSFPRTISLDSLKAHPAFQDSPLIRKGNRLSVLPITPAQWEGILAMANA